MSLYGHARSVFRHRKRSSCWPIPRLSLLVSSTLFRIVSLIPGVWGEVSFSFVPGFVAKTQDPSSLAPQFEGFSVPALPNARISMGDCYVLCRRSGVTLTVLLHIVRVVSGCLSPQGVARRRYRRPLAPEDNITSLPTLGYGTACSCPSCSGNSWYCSVSSF